MGMPNIVFRCQMFRGDWDQVWSQMRMLWLLEGLCRVNQTHLRQFDEFRARGLVEHGYPTLYRSGLHYETEKGTEIWPDVPSLLMGTMGRGVYPGVWGDCLPVSTLVLMDDYTVRAIGSLVPGDRIMGDGKLTTVTKHAFTGEKPILALDLNNGSVLRCSPEHRVFLRDGSEKRAEDVRPSDLLRTPTVEFEAFAPSHSFGLKPNSRRDSARVVGVRECEPELCCDITTDTGRFYLPESDVIVHNCEDLACYRTAELRELPWHYERPAPWDKKKTESADPRFPQGDAERAASAAGKSWPGWKRIKGGVRAKPFAKWRRGPQGNYHYHALTLLPDGRLEDPSLVLGMGREAEFAAEGTAEKMRAGEVAVVVQFAKAPEVMVVDPEKPSGYNGGAAVKLDREVLALLAKREDLAAGDPEVGAYLSNSVLLGEGEFDVDAAIGWSRAEGRFVPRGVASEARRLLGYAGHR